MLLLNLLAFLTVYKIFIQPITVLQLSEKSVTNHPFSNQSSLTTTVLAPKLMEEEFMIMKLIHEYFIETQNYLNANFSLDCLEEDLEIPRKKLSQTINHQTGGNFYRFLAKYRIEYAKHLIVTHSNYSFDFLCSMSGFTSKTCFNRYFKGIVGVTPSEYKLMFN